MLHNRVPSFPEFRKITIDDKKIFNSYFIKHGSFSSEYTFANFFCWRHCDHSKITIINDNLCVLAENRDGETYFFEPLGDKKITDTVKICMDHLAKKGYKPRFSRLSENFIEQFKSNNEYILEPDRNNFDYIYDAMDLVELKGKRFDGKRNRINKFLKVYKSEYRALASSDIPDCSRLLERWKIEKKGLCMDEPIRQALKNFEALDLKGSIVLIDGNIKAFTIGEKLNNDTAVIYIEVASSKYAGLSQYINQKYSEEWSEYKYINREQDLGDKGLRRAKQSYYPSKMIRKYYMLVRA